MLPFMYREFVMPDALHNMPTKTAYKKGDLRRMLSVLGAIAALENATLIRIAALTGLSNKTVTALIEQAREQAGVGIEKVGPQYRISDWGLVIRPEGAATALAGALNASST
jgi:biotin operon repressor